MARVSNPWVGYLDRSFQQIKQSLLQRLITNNPEITDHSESNLLVIIISMFSGVAEMLNYYIDNFARESFIGTARRFASMVKLVRLLDYRIKARSAASATITFTGLDGGGLPIALTANGVVPEGTRVTTQSGFIFFTTEELIVPLGQSAGVVGAREVTKVIGLDIGTTNASANQAFSLGGIYVHDSVTISIDGDTTWELRGTLGLSKPTDKHFIVEIDVDGLAKLIFGDDTNGMIPPSGFLVIADFETTNGPDGNVDANTIITLLDTITFPGAASVGVNNVDAASGGALYEDVGKLRVSAPLSIRTLDRAVTFQDYEDIGRLAPGVGLAAVDFDCGKTVDLYIAPEGGGIAQLPLLGSTSAFMDLRRMVTTTIRMFPAGETRLKLTIVASARFRQDTTQARQDIIDALINYGAFANQNINRRVRTSDIIALLDNLEKIDFLELSTLKALPYARPINNNTPLNWTREPQAGSTTKAVWKLVKQPAGFSVFKDLNFEGVAGIGVPFTDSNNTIIMNISAGAYINGDQYEFTTFPINEDVVLDDNTVPKVEEIDLSVTVNEQLMPTI